MLYMHSNVQRSSVPNALIAIVLLSNITVSESSFTVDSIVRLFLFIFTPIIL